MRVVLGRMSEYADLGALADVATAAESVFDYEKGVLEVIARRVGYDVAMIKRAGGLGPYAPGLDPTVRSAVDKHWPQFAQDVLPVARAGLASGGVAVDLEVLGLRRLERLSYYQRLMKPHGGRSTALLCLTQRRRPIATMALGRTTAVFNPRELAYLRAITNTLSLCEATVLSASPRRMLAAGAEALTARERAVLEYLELGYTNAQIGSALGTAERTVRNQLSSIYEKLGVGSRAEAAALGIRLRIHAAW